MRFGLALPIVAIAGVVSGCGAANAPAPVNGAALFREACGNCHSLVGNESLHRQGGDLLHYDLGPEILRQFTREMPVRPRLDAKQLAVIVEYVYRAEHRAKRRATP
jgi:mono/diheme cytochrome c family protein